MVITNQTDLSTSTNAILNLIRRHRIDMTNEKLAQGQIERMLTAAGMVFERECRLCESDIPDFFIPNEGLVLEVKIRNSKKMEVFRQLKRYAAHERVKALVLITNLSMGLPPEIDGKPTFYASLGAAWL